MADPFITLNGDPGEFLSRADENLLDADTAHLQQSLGLWQVEGSGIAISQVQVLDPVFGDFHGQAQASAGTTFFGIRVAEEQVAIVGNGVVPVTVLCSVGSSSDTAILLTRTYFQGASQIGSSESVTVQTTSGQWSVASITGTPPPIGADSVRLQIRKDGNANDGEQVYWDAFVVRQDAVSTFVPSLRIVGSFTQEIRLRYPSWTNIGGLEQAFLDRGAVVSDPTISAFSFVRRFAQAGQIQTTISNGVGFVFANTDAVPIVIPDDTFATITAEGDQVSGEMEFLVDGVSHDIRPGGFPIGGMFAGGAVLAVNVGALRQGTADFIDADIEFASMYDGLASAGAPLVYRMDAADALGSVS